MLIFFSAKTLLTFPLLALLSLAIKDLAYRKPAIHPLMVNKISPFFT
jgi:hypothetical protein